MSKVNIVITAGGTNEKIDEVRKITNMSTGALGVKIANQITENHLDKIDTIFYVCSKHAKQPNHEKIRIIHTESVEDVSNALDSLLVQNKIDYFIHSMAISDYTTDSVLSKKLLAEELEQAVHSCLRRLNNTPFGSPPSRYILQDTIKRVLENPVKSKIDNSSKMSSSITDPMITLKPTEKIISKIKELSPKTFLVGFKLLNGVEESELFDVAFKLLRKNRCNLVLANDLRLIKKGLHTGLLVYPEKKYDKLFGKDDIAKTLVDTMFKRGESRHPNSIQESDTSDIEQDDYCTLYEVGKQLFEKNLLPIVESGTYGNMSIKKENGFIITGRNVQKGNLTKEMLVKINGVKELSKEEDKDVYAKVHYEGAVKPSIDSAIHHHLYKHTTHQAILHVHTDKIFHGHPLTTYNYACGTEDEMLSILECLQTRKTDIIQMYKHGLIILGETLPECLEKLNALFKNQMNIDPVNLTSDEVEMNEWWNHYEEVKIDGVESSVDIKNPDKYWIVKKENEKLAVLFIDEVDSELQFVLYGLENKRKKGQNIAGNVIDILSTLAKNKELKRLKVVTVDDCRVSQFYQEKHGFSKVHLNSDIIELIKNV